MSQFFLSFSSSVSQEGFFLPSSFSHKLLLLFFLHTFKLLRIRAGKRIQEQTNKQTKKNVVQKNNKNNNDKGMDFRGKKTFLIKLSNVRFASTSFIEIHIAYEKVGKCSTHMCHDVFNQRSFKW